MNSPASPPRSATVHSSALPDISSSPNGLYASYGFVRRPDTDLDYFDSVGQIANTIVCRSDILPGPIQSQIDDLLRGIASGSWERTRELGRKARAVYRLAAPGRDRRELRVW